MSKINEIFYKIKKSIKSGEIDNRLPSENELCSIYNCSRSTIRQVINSLHSYGIIYSKQGKGHFISRNLVENRIKGFEDKQLLRMRKKFRNEIHNVQFTHDKFEKYHLDNAVVYQKIRWDNDFVIEEAYVVINRWLISNFNEEKARESIVEFLEVDQNIKLKYEENIMKCVPKTDKHIVDTSSNLLIYGKSTYYNENDEIVCIIDYFLAPEYFVTKNIYYG